LDQASSQSLVRFPELALRLDVLQKRTNALGPLAHDVLADHPIGIVVDGTVQSAVEPATIHRQPLCHAWLIEHRDIIGRTPLIGEAQRLAISSRAHISETKIKRFLPLI
jgi:hypothetical protein